MVAQNWVSDAFDVLRLVLILIEKKVHEKYEEINFYLFPVR